MYLYIIYLVLVFIIIHLLMRYDIMLWYLFIVKGETSSSGLSSLLGWYISINELEEYNNTIQVHVHIHVYDGQIGWYNK